MQAVTQVDWTDELNLVDNDYKGRVQNLLKRFDFESTNDRTKCKHYPLDMQCGTSPEETSTALELMSNAFYSLLHKELSAAVINSGRVEAVECSFDERFKSKAVKIGKIYATPPNKFSTVNTDLESLQPFAYAYKTDDQYEVMGEINFGIEIY